ncbi:MAG: hypothetical protein WCQ74_00760 [Saccharofermentanales bacterium]
MRYGIQATWMNTTETILFHNILPKGVKTFVLIEILTEDKSGALVVERLASRICERNGVDAQINVRPHRGCGSIPKDLLAKPAKFASSLLDLLPAKCRAYNSVYDQTGCILVVVMDSDDNDPDLLRSQLYNICRTFAPGIRSVIGLSTEEIEAWLLGDKRALLSAYPDSDMDAYKDYVQDSICGTWEVLCRVVYPENYEELINIGYPAIGHYKARWADAISASMEPDRNVSPSFKNFENSLVAAFKSPIPITRHYTSFGRKRENG